MATTLRIDSFQEINVAERTEIGVDYVDGSETLLVRSAEGLTAGQSIYVGQLLESPTSINILELTESADSAAKPEGMTENNFTFENSHSINLAAGSPDAIQSSTLTTVRVDQTR